MKRFFDIILSALAILVLSPFLVPIIIILLLTGEHYVFYTQDRVGKDGKAFKLLKFATMLKNSPNMGSGDITQKNDPRVLPFGKFLRKTKINELPQLYNIVKGDMSVIGPRPITRKNFNYYAPDIQKEIGKLLPGLSGIGSLIFRDEESYLPKDGSDQILFYKTYIAPYKGALEIWYSQNKNLWIDFQIIVLTVWVVISPASQLPYKWFRDLPQKPSWLER
jgi:lipopolysaccharide/colanic/teichoic acid biosynthesis glycosyltransferase